LDIRGNCTISFIDSTLTNEVINSMLQLTPTKIVNKGQIVSEVLKKRAESNKWIYREPLIGEEEPHQTLTRLLNRLESEKARYVIKSCNDAVIGLYLNSDYGQLGFELSIETIAKLSQLKVRLEIHILSFGMVK